MKPRSVKILKEEELVELSTPRLLKFLGKLQRCEESIEGSDWSLEDISNIEGVIFKSSSEWLQQYCLVKSILSNRPNAN